MSEFEIVNGDGLAGMQALPDGCADAMITDPPYCSGGFTETGVRNGKGMVSSEILRRDGWFSADNMGTSGLVFLLRAVMFEATRVVKRTGSMIVFCDWRMFATLAPALESSGVRLQNLIVWDKGYAGMGNGFRAQHELAMHFTQGTAEYYSKMNGNVLKCQRIDQKAREHPTEKPVELVGKMVETVAGVGGLVVDPFCGSGSHGVAALLHGRRFWGADRDRNHVETARRRCNEAVADFARPTIQQELTL